MKKIRFFLYASAIALLSMTGFTACSSSDDATTVEPGPNYNPETNEVITKLVMNVSSGNMRQTSAATQAGSSDPFRGIDHAVLFTFKQGTDGKHIATASSANKRIDLSRIMAAGTMSQDMSTRVIETSLPLNTNTLMFYGKAIKGTATESEINAGFSDYDLYGHLEDYSVAGSSDGLDLGDTTFELSSRITGYKDNFEKIEALFAGVLTVIMNSNLMGVHHLAVTFDNQDVNYPDDLTWASYANANNKSPVDPTKDLAELEVKLAKAYREMTTIQDAELRAGCGEAILETIEDLWSIVNEVRCAEPFCAEEAVAKLLATKIHDRIKKYFNGTVNDDGSQVTNVSFVLADNMITYLLADDAWPSSADAKPSTSYFEAIKNLTGVNLRNFPQLLYHVPVGATHYLFDSTKKQFYYAVNFNSSAVGNQNFTVESYYYPAELLYFGNSPIRVSQQENKTNDYPQTVTNWQNDTQWGTDWTKNSHVTSTTQSVAMMNNINYGTSLLKATVGYGGATTLEDNNHAIQLQKDPSISDTDEPNKQITVGNTSFLLKGVIIGGQPKKVGWDFTPKANTQTGFVYDCVVPNNGSIPASGVSSPNYTLVFDNYTTATTGQEKVYVALELLNNTGVDFYGENGLIRHGGTFYLIGELNPTGKTAPTWPTHHPLPPYNANGTSIETPRVFMQDYMTSANFVIGVNSLKHAYLTVPDLRYSAMTLGLSVDINWSTGIDFGNVILGGDN